MFSERVKKDGGRASRCIFMQNRLYIYAENACLGHRTVYLCILIYQLSDVRAADDGKPGR